MEGRALTVLVLGVGGNVSQGIMKALALADLPVRILAGCINARSLGLYLADRSFITPLAADERFGSWLENVCDREGVDVVLSGAEPVLERLAADASTLCERTGALALVSSPAVLGVGQDKLTTARWLERQGLRAPRTADPAEPGALEALGRTGVALIAKPRWGKGGAGVRRLSGPGELAELEGRSDIVVQEWLPDEQGEFTVGCVCDRDGEPRGSVTLRRSLQAGTTVVAEVEDRPEVIAYAEAVARALRPNGPLNVQLRLVRGAPVAFELNVRFSGTTPLRARLGFNEVEACLLHFALGQPLAPGAARGGSVVRYWNELYVPPEAARRLEQDGRLDDPRSHDPVVEDWGIAEGGGDSEHQAPPAGAAGE